MNESAYRELKFSCTQCSMCCRFDSGYVFLSRADLSRLASGLEMSTREFADTYCRVIDLAAFKQLSLAEKPNKDCVFWADGGCTVYEHRPLQCQSYPFWAHQLSSAEAWSQAEKECPGIGIGERHSAATIEQWLEARRMAPPANAETLFAEDE